MYMEGARLFEAHDTNDESDGTDGGTVKLERRVIPVVRNDEYRVIGRAGADAFYQRALVGIQNIHFIPLEKQVGHGYALAGYEVAGRVLRIHRRTLYRYEEISPPKGGDNIPLTLVFEDRRIASKSTGHSRYGQQRNAFGPCGRFIHVRNTVLRSVLRNVHA